jgi:hypothetical protein
MEPILDDLQRIILSAAGAAVTALCLYAFAWLRTYLGIKESDDNEGAIRRAAKTEAGKLLQTNTLNDPDKLAEAVRKVVADLKPQVKAEGYDGSDIKDMIIGAAATIFPPANLLKLLK